MLPTATVTRGDLPTAILSRDTLSAEVTRGDMTAGSGAFVGGLISQALLGLVVATGAALVLVSGVSANAAVGTVTASGGSSGNASPAGLSAPAALGTVVATGAAAVSPGGLSSVANLGTAVAKGGAATSPAGLAASPALGTSVAQGGAVASPAGLASIAALGTATATGGSSGSGNATPGGLSAPAALGTAIATGGAATAPAGLSATAALGTIVATGAANKAVTGLISTAALGTVVASGSAVASPPGRSAIAALGSVVATGGANKVVSGLSAPAARGTPVATGGANKNVTGLSAPAALGTVTASGGSSGTPVDFLLKFAGAESGNLITVSRLNAATLTSDTSGFWELPYNSGAALTRTRVSPTTIASRNALSYGGTDYTTGYGYEINMASRTDSDGAFEGFARRFTSGKTNFTLVATFKFESALVPPNSVALDVLTIQSAAGTYAVAQQGIAYNESVPGFLRAHGQVGVVSGKGLPIAIPNNTGWFEIHLRHNATLQQAEVALIDASTGILIGTSSQPSDLVEVYNTVFHDYLISHGGKLTAGMIAADWTTAAFPIGPCTVPDVTGLLVQQVANGAIALTFSTISLTAKIERNVNSGGWSTLAASVATQPGVNSYLDATVTAGNSYQYRVTAFLGASNASAVSATAVSVVTKTFTSVATDSFTGTGALSGSWTDFVAGLARVSNQVSASLTDNIAVSAYTGTTPAANARATITLRSTPSANKKYAFLIRYDGGAGDGYVATIDGTTATIGKDTGYTPANRARGAVAFASGDTFGVDIIGGGIALFKNGTPVLGAVDTDITAAQPVILLVEAVGSQTIAGDDFVLENIT